MLKTDQTCNKKGKWNNKTTGDITKYLENSHNLTTLLDADLRIIIRYLKRIGNNNLRESDRKAEKVKKICEIIQLQNVESVEGVNHGKRRGKRTLTDVLTLQELAFREFSKFKKSDLNIIYAEYVWPERLIQWQKKYFIYKTDLYQEENTATCSKQTESCLFYIPAFSNHRGQFEVSCVDSSHLLTRTRRKCCKGGLDGFSNSAWDKVARSGKTNLSLAMTESIIDQMSVKTALTHFSESVEQEMVANGDTDEASLCRDIREWWWAEDNPGISAKHRIKMRIGLRNRLLDNIDLSNFPPPGMYIKGWPTQLWEAIVANIDAKTILYKLAKVNTYNPRAFSSLAGETFFSELTLYDRRGQGTVTMSEFQSFISTAIEKLHIRLDSLR